MFLIQGTINPACIESTPMKSCCMFAVEKIEKRAGSGHDLTSSWLQEHRFFYLVPIFFFKNTRFGQFSYQGQIFVVQTFQSSLGLSGQNTCRDKHLPADDKYLKHGFIFMLCIHYGHNKASAVIFQTSYYYFFSSRATTFVTMMYFIQPEQISLLLSPSQECGRKLMNKLTNSLSHRLLFKYLGPHFNLLGTTVVPGLLQLSVIGLIKENQWQPSSTKQCNEVWIVVSLYIYISFFWFIFLWFNSYFTLFFWMVMCVNINVTTLTL